MKRIATTLLLLFVGCSSGSSLVGKRIEVTDGMEVLAFKNKDQAIQVLELTDSLTKASPDQETDAATGFIKQLQLIGQVKSMTPSTILDVVRVESYVTKGNKEVELVQLKNGYWIPNRDQGLQKQAGLVPKT